MIEMIATRLREREAEISRWMKERLGTRPPPVTLSCDIRNAGFKTAVIDTNLFPSGFNNLCETFSENATAAFRNYFASFTSPARQVAVRQVHIYPEAHTRNLHYQENLRSLARMIGQAGFEVSTGLEIPASADLILLNNDLSDGIPEILREAQISIVPPPALGWHSRRKSDHFKLYDNLVREAASLLDLDPWLLMPLSAVVPEINLEDDSCRQRLQEAANRLLEQITQKYRQYGIRQEPFLFIKNNAGTYGLGILPIDSGEEILTLSRRMKNKLLYAKGNRPVTDLLLQEGIETVDHFQGKPLEPVVYLVGGEPVGTFFRYHDEKGSRENLNSPGMRFSCICLHRVDETPFSLDPTEKNDLFTLAEFLGRVAALAAGEEMEIRGSVVSATSP